MIAIISLFFVGVKRLELSTPCTPCKCASQLRHTPMLISCEMRLQKYNFFYYVVHFFQRKFLLFLQAFFYLYYCRKILLYILSFIKTNL